MTDERLKAAAVEGFKDSLQLANDLLTGLFTVPVAIVSSFVHHARPPEHRGDLATTTSCPPPGEHRGRTGTDG
jgi:hypothetical protein